MAYNIFHTAKSVGCKVPETIAPGIPELSCNSNFSMLFLLTMARNVWNRSSLARRLMDLKMTTLTLTTLPSKKVRALLCMVQHTQKLFHLRYLHDGLSTKLEWKVCEFFHLVFKFLWRVGECKASWIWTSGSGSPFVFSLSKRAEELLSSFPGQGDFVTQETNPTQMLAKGSSEALLWQVVPSWGDRIFSSQRI